VFSSQLKSSSKPSKQGLVKKFTTFGAGVLATFINKNMQRNEFLGTNLKNSIKTKRGM